MHESNPTSPVFSLSLLKDVISKAVSGNKDEGCKNDCADCPCKNTDAGSQPGQKKREGDCHEQC